MELMEVNRLQEDKANLPLKCKEEPLIQAEPMELDSLPAMEPTPDIEVPLEEILEAVREAASKANKEVTSKEATNKEATSKVDLNREDQGFPHLTAALTSTKRSEG